MGHLHRSGAAVVTVMLTMSLVACGGGASAPATDVPVGAASPATIAPASDAPAATAATGGAAEPSEKLIATDGRVIVYPPGWWTKEDMGIVYVASGEDAANALVMSGALKPGQAYVQFGQNTVLSGGTTDPAVHLPDNLKLLIEGQGMTAGTPAGVTVGGKPAATLTASNDKLQLFAVSVLVKEDQFADVIAYGPPGEEEALRALVMKMVEGTTYPAG